jgi:cytochrome c oxidase cbb3-type subunit IV
VSVEDITKYQAYGYFGVIVVLTVILYVYIYYLYSRQKKGIKDFERYSDIALKDNIDDAPVEDISKYKEKEKKEEGK